MYTQRFLTRLCYCTLMLYRLLGIDLGSVCKIAVAGKLVKPQRKMRNAFLQPGKPYARSNSHIFSYLTGGKCNTHFYNHASLVLAAVFISAFRNSELYCCFWRRRSKLQINGYYTGAVNIWFLQQRKF